MCTVLTRGLGDGLAKFGRARCKMASVQEEFANRLGDGYMANLGESVRSGPWYLG